MTIQILAGVGVLLIGVGVFIGMLALAKTLKRVNKTLDAVDKQLEGIGPPMTSTLTHVDAIAETAGHTLARLDGAAQSFENATGTLAQTAALAKDALSPALVNLGAVVTGISSGLRRLFTGKKSDGQPFN